MPAIPGAPGIGQFNKRIEIRRQENSTAEEVKDIGAQIDKLRKQLDALQQALPKSEKQQPKESKQPAKSKPAEEAKSESKV